MKAVVCPQYYTLKSNEVRKAVIGGLPVSKVTNAATRKTVYKNSV